MRVFVAGASGVVGKPIVELLVAEGHVVAAMTRSPGKAAALQALGAKPVICDAYDAEGLQRAVAEFAPEVVLNELTDLPDFESDIDPAKNPRMRTEGHANLLAAAGDAKYIVQSAAFKLGPEGTRAIEELERTTLERGGVALRYGTFYGPGTYHVDELPSPPRISIADAARRTVAALDAPSGIIEIVDA